MRIVLLERDQGPTSLPDPRQALKAPDGLLAVGGSLEPDWLLHAYSHGIFPWYEEGQPILWWSPDPRAILLPEWFTVSRSLARTIRRGKFRCTADQAFDRVIDGCAGPRDGQQGTWITSRMRAAYLRLHELGHAHSVEAWLGEELAGGLYGVAIGQVFFGESMFTRVSDASKVALTWLVEHLARWNYRLIDCQQDTAHLARMGSQPVSRDKFLQRLEVLTTASPAPDSWHHRPLQAKPA